MVKINIPLIETRDVFIGTGSQTTFTLSHPNPYHIHVFISGIYLTEGADYIVSGNSIYFVEVPLLDENINVLYKY